MKKPGCYRFESGDVLVVYEREGKVKTDLIDKLFQKT
jgi:hypothetical protein